jgi:hypothetical protein
MKAVRLRLSLPDDAVHPMHEFVARRDDFTRSRLLHWNPAPGRTNTMIFHVEGDDPDAYESALRDLESVREHHLAVEGDGSFYAYVRERQSPTDEQLSGAFTRQDLVVVSPIEYRSDRSMVFTLVGAGRATQTALEEAPTEIDADVLHVTEYAGQAFDPSLGLTPRQREAVEAAVDVGYYGSTREGSVSDVAETLGCSAGTAAEHLRKAEAELMSRVVERRL